MKLAETLNIQDIDITNIDTSVFGVDKERNALLEECISENANAFMEHMMKTNDTFDTSHIMTMLVQTIDGWNPQGENEERYAYYILGCALRDLEHHLISFGAKV